MGGREVSKNDNWTTPKKLFTYLDSIYDFNLDAAASKENALCARYLTKEDNALDYKIQNVDRIFCNPPYSLAKEFAEHFLQVGYNCVMLLPVRSDRNWFQVLLHSPYIKTAWITGRLHFGGSGKGAFMYSILMINGFDEIGHASPKSLWLGASLFNDNGKGGS